MTIEKNRDLKICKQPLLLALLFGTLSFSLSSVVNAEDQPLTETTEARIEEEMPVVEEEQVAEVEPIVENALGAIKNANAEGTIPVWDGGIQKPIPGYKKGDHHPDPFDGEKPLFKITGATVDQYQDKLSPGQIEMFKKYPTYYMNIYPTHRSTAYPQKVYDAVAVNAQKAKLIEDGNGVSGARITSPFPNPKDGLEAVWNHLLRYRGEKVKRRSGQANPTPSGSYTMIMFEDDLLMNYALDSYQEGDNIFAYFTQRIVEPARLSGEILLIHETINQVKEPRHSWTYNPGQRRVRRAPNIAYDNPGTASDGLRTNDQLDMFNGAPDRYEWKLLGRKEMFVPYNAYKVHSDKLKYDDIIKPGHLNPEHMRYELHRVWVVEGTLKSGTSHIYSKRTFVIDEDSWSILVADHYDSRGTIWRVAEAHCINYYEVPVFWTTLEVVYDLRSGRYTANGFDNQEPVYNYSTNVTAADFKPETLRRAGLR